MNRSKTKKLALLTTVSILVATSVLAVQVASKSGNPGFPEKSISIRPIEDWLANNPFGSGPGYLDPDSMLSQRSLGWVEYDVESYEGLITERVMPDHSLHITIHLKVEGMPIAIRNWTAEEVEDEWIFYGKMDYTFVAEIILKKQIPGGPLRDWDFGDDVLDEDGNPAPLIETFETISRGKREPGCELPVWWIILFYPDEVGGQYVMNDFTSDASGHYIEPGWAPYMLGDDPPTFPVLLGEGNVKVHQLAIYSDNFVVGDPGVVQYTSWSVPEGVFYDGGPLVQSPLLMPEMWPYEYVTFY